ncbi:pentapeptide repeat-containing protein [Streptomyces huiliensis]|uniref:pentapeptide repeat-containing protein n=1 Tax=Streptomyces huiliensis TaxID=2876027 RepID=UPI001CBBFDFD|nr:pentapeptide repeat-containing protein [Streptomyces huiliensis]MBZ4319595.1 pentapeptide repeat-containing protein [Streptomyces huiliensis]
MRIPAPRELAELPYAHRLAPFTGAMERAESHEGVHFDGCVFEDAEGGRSLFSEAAFSSAVFERGSFRRSRFDDVWLHATRMVGTGLADTTWLDVEFTAGVLAGTEIHGAELRRVVFRQCKLDSVNLRAATLREVAFVDCLLRDVDFGGATLTDVHFPGSTLERARFDRATLAKVDLREATALGIAAGLGDLGGATISTPQLFDLAPALAQHVGLAVKDD